MCMSIPATHNLVLHDNKMSALIPQGLLSSIETTVSYALVRYGAYLPVTITEMSFTRGDTSSTKELYHANCTFPLLLSTFALFKYPDKVVSRLLANNEVGEEIDAGTENA